MRMTKRAWWGEVVLVVCMQASLAPGDLVVDVDPFVPGIQSSLSVLSGASITVITYYDPAGAPIPFNAFGVNLEWAPFIAATALPSSPPIAGSIAGMSPAAVDIMTGGGPISPGMPLVSGGMPPAMGTAAIGGNGLSDLTGSFWGFGGPVLLPMDLFGVTFTISGAPGDGIFFYPTGILPPGGATPGGGPFLIGGDPWQDGSAAPTFTIPDSIVFGTITIVPEPAVAIYLMLGAGLMGIRGRRAAA